MPPPDPSPLSDHPQPGRVWQKPELRRLGDIKDIAQQGGGSLQGNGRRGLVLS